MAIVSLSFPDQMIREMDQIQRSGGFAGRSELVRSAIRLLLEDSRVRRALPPRRRRKEGGVNDARIPKGGQVEECQARRDRVNVDRWIRLRLGSFRILPRRRQAVQLVKGDRTVN